MKIFISFSQTAGRECHAACVHQSPDDDVADHGKSFRMDCRLKPTRISMRKVVFSYAVDFKRSFKQQSVM